MNSETPPPIPRRPKSYQDIFSANLLVIPGLGTWWIGQKDTACFQIIGALIGMGITLMGIVLIISDWDQLPAEDSLGPISIHGLFILLKGMIFFKVFWAWGFYTAWKYKKSFSRI